MMDFASWPVIVAICLVLIGSAAVAAYNFFEGETLLRDCWDELILANRSLLALDKSSAANLNRCEIVVSLTTIPTRIAAMEPTLKSLLRQNMAPAKLIINIPSWSKREQRAYDIPSFLKGLVSVEIRSCEDFGPATKLLPTLLAAQPDDMIIAVDDDRIYPKTFIADLAEYATRHPDAALGFSGWVVPDDLIDRPTSISSNFFMRPPVPIRCRRIKAPMAVDVLQGFSGYLTRPRFFNLIELCDYSKAPPSAFFVDDVWISAHCKAQKLVVPSARANYQPKLRRRFFKRSSLGLINRGGGDPLLRSNTIVLRYFAGRWKTSQDRPHQSQRD